MRKRRKFIYKKILFGGRSRLWKDKRGGKGLSVLVTYRITGLNLDRFINTVKNRGIALYDVKKQSQNSIKVSVSLKVCALKLFSNIEIAPSKPTS